MYDDDNDAFCFATYSILAHAFAHADIIFDTHIGSNGFQNLNCLPSGHH